MKRGIKKQLRLLTILQFLELSDCSVVYKNNALIRYHLRLYTDFGGVHTVHYNINDRVHYNMNFKQFRLSQFIS